MTIAVSNGLIIELGQITKQGTPWQVRVYKKVLGFRKRISSDWFLDEEQARKFADQLTKQLQSNSSTNSLKQRQPGWTLHHPPH